MADSSALAAEILNAAPTVQAYTHEAIESARYAALVEAAFRSAMKRARWRALLTLMIISAVFGAILFVLWLGARSVASGSMTSGQLTSFVLYAVIVAGACGTLSEVWGDIMRAAGAAERLMELLQTKALLTEVARPVPLRAAQTARIQFDRVSFRYPSRPLAAALDGLSLTAEDGETVALVGPSGAGKTTVFQLIQRFYDASSGVVRFNGFDVRSLSLESLRGAIAIVPQDPVIFSADALDNIRYGRPEAGDHEVKRAARLALADEFIQDLPHGYHTFLGERGVRLSGGQRQRIAIARAILKNAPLLLLDEATSALDAESERLVQGGLEAAMRDRTTLIIAHRLTTVQRADRIVVMEHGSVVEQGRPADLRQSGGLYSRMAELQIHV
jgi:ATP-binding cassette subfamily B protein